MKNTLALEFKKVAKKLMPNQSSLQELDESIDDAGHIDEIMFRHGEYIGGMADVILVLIDRNIKV